MLMSNAWFTQEINKKIHSNIHADCFIWNMNTCIIKISMDLYENINHVKILIN